MAGSVSTGSAAVAGTLRPGRLVMAGDQDSCPRVGRESRVPNATALLSPRTALLESRVKLLSTIADLLERFSIDEVRHAES
jgi:hypothetical protein